MSKTSRQEQSSATFHFSSETKANPIAGIQQFFNGDPIDKIRSDLDSLRDTTITESYGDLDKDDKWLIIDFFRRISNLVEATHLLITVSKALKWQPLLPVNHIAVFPMKHSSKQVWLSI